MPCYMKIDDLTLGFPKGPAINVSGILEKTNGNANTSSKLCFESNIYFNLTE